MTSLVFLLAAWVAVVVFAVVLCRAAALADRERGGVA